MFVCRCLYQELAFIYVRPEGGTYELIETETDEDAWSHLGMITVTTVARTPWMYCNRYIFPLF